MTRFILLSFGITWLAVLPLVLSALGVIPSLPAWLHGLGALGPAAAAYLSKRERGVYAATGPSALSPGWIAACMGTPVLFSALALIAAAGLSEPIVRPLATAFGDREWVIGLLVGSLLYGFGEEPGWRGWLQPHLQARHSPLVATVLLTPIWACWHAPFFFYRFRFEGAVTVAGFFIGLLAGAFWLAFLYNSTRSVTIVSWWHVLWNVANIALAAVSATAVGVLNGLMMVLGFGVAAIWGSRGLSVRGRL